MKIFSATLFCLIFYTCAYCQGLTRIPDYDLVDSIRLNRNEIVYVGFNDEDESAIVQVSNGKQTRYQKVLTCYSCKGRGSRGTTYGGHELSGKVVAFIQNYCNGVDSVFIDFLLRNLLSNKSSGTHTTRKKREIQTTWVIFCLRQRAQCLSPYSICHWTEMTQK